MTSKLERMSKRQRELTPRRLALELVERVMREFGVERVAALWVAKRSTYRTMTDMVECYGVERDAYVYAGPLPVICHPPCGPWGKLAWRSRQDPTQAIRAMTLVHRYGGVVEQPVGSCLFRLFGKPGAVIERINQGDYGLKAPKPTLLYWWKKDQ